MQARTRVPQQATQGELRLLCVAFPKQSLRDHSHLRYLDRAHTPEGIAHAESFDPSIAPTLLEEQWPPVLNSFNTRNKMRHKPDEFSLIISPKRFLQNL